MRFSIPTTRSVISETGFYISCSTSLIAIGNMQRMLLSEWYRHDQGYWRTSAPSIPISNLCRRRLVPSQREISFLVFQQMDPCGDVTSSKATGIVSGTSPAGPHCWTRRNLIKLSKCKWLTASESNVFFTYSADEIPPSLRHRGCPWERR